MKSHIRDVIIYFFVVLAIAAGLTSLHYARVAKYEATKLAESVPKEALSTDQMLASLSTNVTVFGCIVAIAAIAVGIGAVFGYTEVRAATLRKTQEDLVKIIKTLETTGELASATASVLLQAVAPEQAIVVPGTSNGPQASNGSTVSGAGEQIANQYPEGGQNG